MGFEELYKTIEVDESMLSAVGFNPYYREISTGLDKKIMVDGREMINLASNNYLGLATDPGVKKAMIEGINKYGASLCGTPIATGYGDIYKAMEKKLSDFVGLEDTIIFPSCYQANNGLFLSIAKKEDVILVDRFAHSSLIQGIKSVGCKIRPFLHNNMEHLEEILKHCTSFRQVFVVTESVFSTDGTIARFKEIVDLCEKYNAIPIIDDSHGIGVLGKSGKGILEEQNITNYKGIYTASLGKALGNAGGIICGERKLIHYLKYYCPHLVYSTALPPSILSGIEEVIRIMEKDFTILKEKLSLYQKMIFTGLKEAGFEVVSSEAPINSIITKSKENTFKVAKKLYENKILSTPFVEPSVSVGEGRVRLIAGANLQVETIEEAVSIIKRMGI